MTNYPDNLTPATPLDTFRRMFQWNPRHFWGWAGSGKAKITAKCAGLLREYGWQDNDAAARSGVREALANAEANLTTYLGYPVLPTYREVTLPYPRLADLTMRRVVPANADGRRLTVQLPESHLIALGTEARTAVGDVELAGVIPYVGASPAAPYLVYRDRDGDGIPDQFEIGITTSVTDAREIAVYVAAGDRWDGSALSERWRITPTAATITGGVATITGPAWVAARPVLWEGEDVSLNGLAPEDGTNYLQSMTVARRYTSAGITLDTAQAVLTWNSNPWPAWACCPTVGSDPASYAQAVARVGVLDAAHCIVTPAQAVYDATSGTWSEVYQWGGWSCREPDEVTIRYLAGVLPADDGQPVQP